VSWRIRHAVTTTQRKVERTSEPSDAAGIPEVPDASLVARIATKRDRQALDLLYRRHGSALYDVALGIVPDPVEARRTVAWVFRQAWRTPSLFDSALVPVSAWLVPPPQPPVERERQTTSSRNVTGRRRATTSSGTVGPATERRHGQQVASLVQVPTKLPPDHVPDRVVPAIVPVAVVPGLAVTSVMLTLLPFTVPVK